MTNEPTDTEQAAQAEASADGESAAAGEGPVADPVEALRQQLAEAREEATDMRDRWQRALADFSNYRRRQEFEKEDAAKYAATSVLAEMLPIMDSFERAFQAIPGELRRLTWIEGVFHIWQLMMQTLARAGATPIDAHNKPFDARYHEAVTHEEGDGPPTVLEVFQTGYLLHERVLRPALVKVGPAPKEQADQQDAREGSAEPADAPDPTPDSAAGHSATSSAAD